MELRVKPRVDYLTKGQLEAAAGNLLDRYEVAESPINGPPVPVEFVVENFLGFDIKWDKLNDDCTLAFIDPNRKLLCLNLDRSSYFDDVGYEYTLAHEIGHWELNHFEPATRQLELGLRDQPSRYLHRANGNRQYRSHEFQAEYFASCLLMPKRLILPTSKEYDLLEWKSLYSINEQFKVSITAVAKRLTDLKLIYIKDKKLYNNEQEAAGIKRLF